MTKQYQDMLFDQGARSGSGENPPITIYPEKDPWLVVEQPWGEFLAVHEALRLKHGIKGKVVARYSTLKAAEEIAEGLASSDQRMNLARMKRELAMRGNPPETSYKVEVLVSGEWVSNALRFPSHTAADLYGIDLLSRWTLAKEYRVVATTDAVTETGDMGAMGKRAMGNPCHGRRRNPRTVPTEEEIKRDSICTAFLDHGLNLYLKEVRNKKTQETLAWHEDDGDLVGPYFMGGATRDLNVGYAIVWLKKNFASLHPLVRMHHD